MTDIRIKLDTSTIKKIALFESITKAKLIDCFDYEGETLFIVDGNDFGKAIGKKGANVKLLEKKFKSKVILVEFNKDPEKFAENILKPIPVKNINIDNTTMNIVILTNQRAFPSKKVKKTKFLLKKYFPNVEEVIVRV